ncbi:hypothetical protein BU15DRAFT_46154, partial [Melanogaster broomeanus]
RLHLLMISGIIAPRLIAFVSTVSKTGASRLPPLPLKVTHNVHLVHQWTRSRSRYHQQCQGNHETVNIISEPWVEQATASDLTSTDAPKSFSGWPISGSTKKPSIHVKPPRVKESAFSMECELFQVIDIIHPVTGKAGSTMLLGHVKYIHVRNDMLTDRGTVDMTLFKPLSRMGDVTYARVGDGLWEQEKDKISELE